MFQSNLNLVVQLKLSAILNFFFSLYYVYLSKHVVLMEIMLYISEVVGTYSYFVN